MRQDTHTPATPSHKWEKGVRCESMTLKEACSVPKHPSAMCVQNLDDSLNSAIHTTYRISLRSSSLREPRYPLSRVLVAFKTQHIRRSRSTAAAVLRSGSNVYRMDWTCNLTLRETKSESHNITVHKGWYGYHDNDPSAGSPTETLLRLLLPLDDKVRSTSRSHAPETGTSTAIQSSHRTIQSVVATGGVYKGQGRNQGGLLNHPY